MTTTASIILLVVGAYVALGVIVGVAFVIRGVSRVDPAAAGTPIGFKLLILPGAVGLWPIVLKWWLGASKAGAKGGTHTALSVRAPSAAQAEPTQGSPQ